MQFTITQLIVHKWILIYFFIIIEIHYKYIIFYNKFIKLILKIKHLHIYNFFNMNMSFFTTGFRKTNQSIDGLVV